MTVLYADGNSVFAGLICGTVIEWVACDFSELRRLPAPPGLKCVRHILQKKDGSARHIVVAYSITTVVCVFSDQRVIQRVDYCDTSLMVLWYLDHLITYSWSKLYISIYRLDY